MSSTLYDCKKARKAKRAKDVSNSCHHKNSSNTHKIMAVQPNYVAAIARPKNRSTKEQGAGKANPLTGITNELSVLR